MSTDRFPVTIVPLRDRCAELGIGFHYRKTGGLSPLPGDRGGQVVFRTWDKASIVLTGIDKVPPPDWSDVVSRLAQPVHVGGWSVYN